MGAPIIWGPNSISTSLQNALRFGNQKFISDNGVYNYIANGTFEGGVTTGWSLAHTTLSSAFPNQASASWTAANGNLSIAASTSSPLSDNYSLTYVSSSATTAGDMLVSNAVTMRSIDSGRVLAFKIPYNAYSNPSNGNFSGSSSNSFGVALYDSTNNVWVMPAGVWNVIQSSGTGYATGTFQMDTTCTSFRIAFFNANATAGAISVKLDDIFVGPQPTAQAPAMSDWASYTPASSQGLGAPTWTDMRWRRVGDSVQLQGNFTTGTVTASEARIALPPGLSTASRSANLLVGYCAQDGASSSSPIGILSPSGQTYFGFGSQNAGASNKLVLATGTAVFVNASPVSFTVTIPITGWSSNSVSSADTDTRVVAAIITGDPASATSGNPIIVPTVGYDSHGGYSASTGRYTVPVAGLYKMFGALQSASSATTLTIYKNAVSTQLAGSLDSNGEATYTGMVNCAAGDIIDIRPAGTVDATNMTLNIQRLSGPAIIQAVDTVAARYYASATSISGSLATIVWTTKDFDTTLSMASGVFTCPVSGKYQVNTALALSGTFALNNQSNLVIQKNSVTVSEALDYAAGAETSAHLSLSDVISCNAGDTIRMQVSSGATGPGIVSSNTKNFISIVRVGS